ncbi:hypothetical protein Cgig2_020385 [Carnegiea gigantea]|uniref:Uncharacterized protein n=1 Tax=Carnegiea gigantea TaxID=171969 RepID=A0A9Q1JJM1_9CARY|nr:hypothetical protein Cgig2_020385 [Carnegiea gigantea]
MQVIGLKDSTFPQSYLGVPITVSRLTKVECPSLLEKIIARAQLWATRNIYFEGRVRLINNVIFRMSSYWASIFLLPKEVTEKITKICRNYLWSGIGQYKKAPIYPGIKHDFAAWKKAIVAKLTRAVTQKKEVLWVKWDYTPPQDASWYWKKICRIKEEFKKGCSNPQRWDWQGDPKYRVAQGYKWQRGRHDKVPWAKFIWARPNVPKYAFIT